MKILFVLGFPNPFAGAGWTRIGFFADAWSDEGHEIAVLGAFGYTSLEKVCPKSGKVNIFNLIFNMGLNQPIVFILNSLSSFMVSTLFLIAKRPDIAIVSVPQGNVGLGALLACKLIHVKHFVDYRDEWEDYEAKLLNSEVGRLFYFAVKKIMSGIYAKSQLVTAVSPAFVDSLKRREVTNVRLVPNGADVTVFKQYEKSAIRKKLGLSNNDFVIVYSGGIGGYYKLDNFVRALKTFSGKIEKVRFIMIGDGPDVPAILELSKNLGLCETVLYLGVKHDKKEIAEILSAGDVGIIPGLYTLGQLPVKLFEYSACGLPVVATVHPDSMLTQIITEYGIGIAVPPKNEEKLVEAFCHLYNNESFRGAAGKRARELVNEQFDRNKIAADFLDLVKAYV